MRWLILAVLCVATVAADRFLYPGYKVYDLYPKDVEDVHFLHNLMITDAHLDFWEEPNKLGKCTVMVPPEHQDNLLEMMYQRSITVQMKHADLEKFITDFWTQYDIDQMNKDPEQRIDTDVFNTLADIETWLDELQDTECGIAGITCEKVSLGNTYEGRDIWRLSMSTGGPKTSFWIDSTIHAREWLAPATVIKIMDHFVSNYGYDPTVTYLLDTYDWHFVPVFNPDGYVYTWTQRMWRKNRSPNSGSSCLGTDLNRNHDWNWGLQGVSHDGCSDTYCGSGPCSELECQAIQAEIQRVHGAQRIEVMMTFHSYGQMWMHPWGNTLDFTSSTACQRAEDHDEMYRLAVITADAIQARYGTTWTRGTSCEVIYATTGATDDWAKGVLEVPHDICPELRGNNFIVSEAQIQPSFEEIWDGIVAQEANL